MKRSITWLLLAVGSGLMVGGGIRLAVELVPLALASVARYVETTSERELMVAAVVLFVFVLPGLTVALVIARRAAAPMQADIRAQYPTPPPRQPGRSQSRWPIALLVTVAVVASLCVAFLSGPVAAVLAVGGGVVIRIAVTVVAALTSD